MVVGPKAERYKRYSGPGDGIALQCIRKSGVKGMMFWIPDRSGKTLSRGVISAHLRENLLRTHLRKKELSGAQSRIATPVLLTIGMVTSHYNRPTEYTLLVSYSGCVPTRHYHVLFLCHLIPYWWCPLRDPLRLGMGRGYQIWMGDGAVAKQNQTCKHSSMI